MGRWIRKWPTWLDSGAQDEQNEYLHRTFSSTRTSVAANDPILPCKFPLNWENPNMDRWIRKRRTWLDSGAQDEQNEYLHRTFSSTRTTVAANDPILPCKFPLNWENPNMGRWIRERPTWLDSGAQDEQNEYQRRSFSAALTILVSKVPYLL